MARPGTKPTPRLDETIEALLASKVPPGEVVDTVVWKFGITERGAWKAIARVRRSWAEAEATTVAERRAKFRVEMDHAWRMALIEGDYRAIAQMARTVADVEGIRQPKKVELSGTVGLRPVQAMNPREREVEIAKLLADRELAAGRPVPALEAPSLDAFALEIPEVAEVDPDAPPADLRPPAKKKKRKGKARKRSVH